MWRNIRPAMGRRALPTRNQQPVPPAPVPTMCTCISIGCAAEAGGLPVIEQEASSKYGKGQQITGCTCFLLPHSLLGALNGIAPRSLQKLICSHEFVAVTSMLGHADKTVPCAKREALFESSHAAGIQFA